MESDINLRAVLTSSLSEHQRAMEYFLDPAPIVLDLANECLQTIKSSGTIFFMGNGGSASDCQHIVAELVGRFKINSQPFPALSLSDNIASITAISNDFSFDEVFARQLSALVKPKDLVVGISTSGKSVNVLNGLEVANQMLAKSVLITGAHKKLRSKHVDYRVEMPSYDTARIQECYMFLFHCICEYVEAKLHIA